MSAGASQAGGLDGADGRAPGVSITRAQDVLEIVLDRPDQRNAITGEMLAILIDALEQAAQDDELRAITIAAAGEHFCAGMDIAASQPAPAWRRDRGPTAGSPAAAGGSPPVDRCRAAPADRARPLG